MRQIRQPHIGDSVSVDPSNLDFLLYITSLDGRTAIEREDLTRLTGGVELVPLASSVALLSSAKSAEDAAAQAIRSSSI